MVFTELHQWAFNRPYATMLEHLARCHLGCVKKLRHSHGIACVAAVHCSVFGLNFVFRRFNLAVCDPRATKNGATAMPSNCWQRNMEKRFRSSTVCRWRCFSQPLQNGAVSPADAFAELCCQGVHLTVISSYERLWFKVLSAPNKTRIAVSTHIQLENTALVRTCYWWWLQQQYLLHISNRPVAQIFK